MSKLTDVIERVQKLLRVVGNSDKPGEVAAAQQMAQKLITKYQLEDAELHGRVKDEDISSKTVSTPNPYAIDKSVLLNSIALPNFCKVLRGDDYCLVYGYESDIDLCIALYDMLSLHMVTEMRTKLEQLKKSSDKRIDSRGWAKSFFAGYAVSIRERIEQAKEATINEVDSAGTSLALVLRDKQHAIEKFWQETVRNAASKRKLSSVSGYQAGMDSAANADLNQPKIER
jgi:hypothetical protein